MTDELARIKSLVDAIVFPHGTDTPDVDNPRQLDELLKQVLSIAAVQPFDALEVLVVALACIMGPRRSGLPPAAIRAALLARVRQELPEEQRLTRAAEIVVAYGADKWEKPAGYGAWSERNWSGATFFVTWHVRGWMSAVHHWVHDVLSLTGYARQAEPPTWHEAHMLAFLFCAGKCDCWRISDESADAPPTHQARARADRCLRQHRLVSWNPSVVDLWSFIAQAMKGSKPRGSGARPTPARQNGNGFSHRSFVAGAVVQGMMFAELHRQHDVRFGIVFGWHCHRPGHEALFLENGGCPSCSRDGDPTPFQLGTHVRTAERRLFVKRETGPYEPGQFQKCSSCSNYSSTYSRECECCREPFGKQVRPTNGWIRT